jgi:hypothetical protein
MEVTAHSDGYTFAATVTTRQLHTGTGMRLRRNGNWFTIDTSKTINSNGEYAYFFTGKPAAKIRMRIASSALAHLP